MNIEVENGIPLPPRCGGKRKKYPVEDLEIGQSFLVPMQNPQDAEMQNSIRSHINKTASRASIKISTRVVPEGLRIWRTK